MDGAYCEKADMEEVGMRVMRMPMLAAVVLLAVWLTVGCAEAEMINWTSHNNTVEGGGYLNVVSGSGNLRLNSSVDEWGGYLNNNNLQRIRQNGTVREISIFIFDASKVNYLNLSFWRREPGESVWTELSSQDISPNITTGINYQIPISPVNVVEGDYVSIGGNQDGDSLLLQSTSASYAISKYRFTGGYIPNSTFDWSTYGTGTVNIIPIKMFMASPSLVAIGDSIVQGAPLHQTFIMNSGTVNLLSQSVKYVAAEYNVTYQNMGIGSQSSSQFRGRFSSDVINLTPRVVIIGGPSNDVALGVLSNTTKENYRWMVGQSINNSIVPVVILTTPSSARTNESWVLHDLLIQNITSLKSEFPEMILANTSTYIGETRVGGPDGNLWDLKNEYDSGDGIHPNIAGYEQIAQSVIDAIDEATHPVAQFIPAGPLTIWYPNGIAFTDTSTGSPTSWDWDFGDGSHSNLQNPTKYYTTPGMYQVVLNASNSYSYSLNSTWLESGTNGFGVSNTSGFVPLPVKFTNSTIGNVTTKLWEFGDGNTSTSVSPTNIYWAAGEYTANYTVTHNGASNSTYRNITVENLDFVSTSGTSFEVAPVFVSFQDLSTVSGTWNWTFGDGGTSTDKNPIHLYIGEKGNFTVSLTATANGQSVTTTKAGYISIGFASNHEKIRNDFSGDLTGFFMAIGIACLFPIIIGIVLIARYLNNPRQQGAPTFLMDNGILLFVLILVLVIVLVFVGVIGGRIETIGL